MSPDTPSTTSAELELSKSRPPTLFIQIPCFNEAETLPAVLQDLPTCIEGIGAIHVLIIDDGSTDGTSTVAKRYGVQHIVRHDVNRGIAVSFQDGLDACLKAGADIIINTDGDHQYPGKEIAPLLQPILAGRADMVVGDRRTQAIEHFTTNKKLLQKLGSWVVRMASSTEVPDAASGFRAMNRECALRLLVLTRFSYTLETIIQAGKKGLRVGHVPITVNPPTRPSRLVRNNWHYIWQQAATILRIYALYEPMRTFTYLSLPFLLAGIFLIGRFLFFYVTGQTYMGRHVQSVVIGGTAVTIGFLIILFGILADISALNRQVLEEMLYRQRKRDLELQ